MEEIIDIKTFENKVEKVPVENKGEISYLKMTGLLEEKRQKLKNIWHDRLAGAPKSVDVWYNILSTR
jgi:FKBP12-rapamycin complex-associated protein